MKAISVAKLTRSPQGLASIDKESPRTDDWAPWGSCFDDLAILSTL